MPSSSASWRARARAILFGLAAVICTLGLTVVGIPAASAAGVSSPAKQQCDDYDYVCNDDEDPDEVVTATNTGSPYLVGNVVVGKTVRLNAGSWSNEDVIDSAWVSWTVSGKPVRKVSVDWPYNNSRYADQLTVPASAVNRTLKAELIVRSRDVYEKERASSRGLKVSAARFSKSATPAIVGTKRVGSTLRVKGGAWSPKPSFRYQWYRSGKPVSNRRASTYRLGSSDLHRSIKVRVTGVRQGYVSSYRTSRAVKIAAGRFARTTAPKLHGTAIAGKRLSAKASGWSPKAKYSYQWLRSGKAIRGAKRSTYKLGAADIGRRVAVRVTGKSAGYASKQRTSASKKVGAYRFTVKKKPSISGSHKAGATLTAHRLVVSPKATKYSYRWLRNGKSIGGATHTKYTVRSGDKGARISVKVTASRKHFKSVSATSKSVKIYKPVKKRSWAYPDDWGDCPAGYPVKGNQSGIYHVPGGRWYDVTTPEECFASAAAAERAGYRASRNG